ncbi:prefoldin subunit, putative [Entamoeba invadens IP1]|uniref:Prefoldin subunit, putative n=1 Tax=Entamoeba invadens IP1 TaxID=370355 RepID=A0A0A1UDR1_ENTIV|nr:prefoldin subunit, putative [Entamoeba invadens IP1]ELP94481.1 prefoldin subunit, putative [Entamoeba invadens IP1]|eukprot:XP_004261252.1 prefoldin subunit, putative [Entamoeba invadens IP1]
MECIADTINLQRLDKYQLAELNQKLVGELEWINSNVKRVADEIRDLNENVDVVNKLQDGKTQTKNVVVPLTPLMCVKGDLTCEGRVIIHIGDVFYISKTFSKAIDYYKRRLHEKDLEKRAYDILLRDRQTVLSRMENIVKLMVQKQNE